MSDVGPESDAHDGVDGLAGVDGLGADPDGSCSGATKALLTAKVGDAGIVGAGDPTDDDDGSGAASVESSAWATSVDAAPEVGAVGSEAGSDGASAGLVTAASGDAAGSSGSDGCGVGAGWGSSDTTDDHDMLGNAGVP